MSLFTKTMTLKPIHWKITYIFLLVFSCSQNVSGNTNETNKTQSTIKLIFNPQELTLERNYQGSIEMFLSSPLNDSIVFTLEQDANDISIGSFHNATLNQTGKLKVTAISQGRTTVLAHKPFPPYDYINVTGAYTVIHVFYSQALHVISDVVGWTYFVFWTLSFYPQIIVNFQRKSVVGLDFNYLSLNFLGHNCYNIFNIGLYWIPSIQALYKDIHPVGVIPVRPNDIGFSMHAVLATGFTVFQCFIYERGTQAVSYSCLGMLAAIFLLLIITLILSIVNVITWLDYLYYFSYVKLAITLFKNCPQVFYNYKRKSTKGFSIWTVLLDFVGGLLSMLQMCLLAYNFDDWSSIFGDLSKFGLGLISVVFDIIYMFQHYILYRKAGLETISEDIMMPVTKSEDTIKPHSSSFAMRY